MEASFNFAALVNSNTEYKVSENTTAELIECANAFAANTYRMRAMLTFIPTIVGLATIRERSICKGEATQPIIGRDRELEILNSLVARDDYDYMKDGLKSMISSALIMIWTSFEILAEGLWNAATNVCGLTNTLRGNGDRIINLAMCGGSDYEATLLKQAAGEYDKPLKNQRISFSTLESVWLWYGLAFGKDSRRIDCILANSKLRELELLRHLLVHKTGKIDDRFSKRLAKATQLHSGLPIGQTIEPDGLHYTTLIESTIKCGEDLIIEIGRWITTHNNAGAM